MPKGKNKGRRQRRREEQPLQDGVVDGDELSGDNMSVTSSTSDTRSVLVDDKMKDAIDGLTQKRKVTLTDGLERCLKKGGAEEQTVAATCIGLLLIQLGSNPESEMLFKEVRPQLNTIMADTSRSPKVRASCAQTLAIGSFIASEELEDIRNVMKSLENVFKASYLKGDGSTPSHTADVAALHTSAISAWTLLLSIAPPPVIQNFLDSHLTKLPELLNSSDVDLRITTGEAIALIYELAREDDEASNFEGDDIIELCETLKQLATDSNKFRAKKDRRQQRANFRDILKAVEEGDSPYYRVRFGLECLEIDSWTRKIQYDALCHMLGTGMYVHLQENEIIRDIFGLGSPIPVSALPVCRGSKAERVSF
ncbi:hypothetical protein LSH36_52g10022 [Paralvinella palmiformis]|uniref:Interferon-related developmental regulator N-terminal domain-containing protein n=1 Tax=Paralvinella palmiformis TaxID=53620 RepID=A0AAD9NCK3_9ANNE|nr:hypothetical protein LSH36_52g10022 [Paralvinella palmiformis]